MIVFGDCRARPDEEGKVFALVTHLKAVAEICAGVSAQEARLLGLAGLLHDAGKGWSKWQAYIRSDDRRRGDVPHAFLGSALFFLVAAKLERKPSEEQRRFILDLTRDLAGHHGRLNDWEHDTPPWRSGWRGESLAETDLEGLAKLVRETVPGLPDFPTDPRELGAELDQMADRWGRWVMTTAAPKSFTEAARVCHRRFTACLVAADRFDAAGIEPAPGLTPAEAEGAVGGWEKYIAGKAEEAARNGGREMAEVRGCLQSRVLEKFAGAESGLYILRLPTGSGKTMLALRLGLEAARKRRKKRIVYVAPYLSILSQAAQEIRAATGQEVLEHHHLSLPDPKGEGKGEAEGAFLVLESWQAPVVATTFNQFFRAFFPARAQQAMRLAALDDAFVIVDEPQILEAGVWNPFLKMLETVVELQNAEALLMTATMPPLEYARLDKPPEDLTPKTVSLPERFSVRVFPESWDEARTASEAVARTEKHGSCACILNTVADAAKVYREASRMAEGKGILVLNLHGAMHPLHKTARIGQIAEALREGRQVLAVTTQVLEAGVDLSFRCIMRARPILPSVMQAAGRANRHGEGERAEVAVFDFRRDGTKDTRNYIYRNEFTRGGTDSLLVENGPIGEADLRRRVGCYYEEVWKRDQKGASLERLVDAASGKWSKLADLEPFGEDRPSVPVFVPLGGPPDAPEAWLDEGTQALITEFDVNSPEDIYRRYEQPGFLRSLSFGERKHFFNLIGRFVVSLDCRLAHGLVSLDPERSIQRLVDTVAYSPETGFGHLGRETEWTDIL